MNDDKKPVDIIFSPEFTLDLSEMTEEQRTEFLEGLNDTIGRLRDNPYTGTPLWGGILNPFIVFVNYIKRKLWALGLRW